MRFQKTSARFWLGFILVFVLTIAGFLWASWNIPNWGAAPGEISMALPGDDLVSQPDLVWNHAITIHAAPEQVYPWLVQIGDTRGGFYSFTFIENLFQIAGNATYRYINADRVHPEWQNPPSGQGIIVDWMAIKEYQAGQYVLATATPKFVGMQWTWLWYLQPAGANTTRLIVRHRYDFPAGTPMGAVTAMLNAGYVMERGMMLGIRSRAEGRIPPAFDQAFQVILWLVAFLCALISFIHFVRRPGRYHPLGVTLEAVIFLFVFTFIQPAIWLRVLLDLVLVGSVALDYLPVRRMLRPVPPKVSQT